MEQEKNRGVKGMRWHFWEFQYLGTTPLSLLSEVITEKNESLHTASEENVENVVSVI